MIKEQFERFGEHMYQTWDLVEQLMNDPKEDIHDTFASYIRLYGKDAQTHKDNFPANLWEFQKRGISLTTETMDLYGKNPYRTYALMQILKLRIEGGNEYHRKEKLNVPGKPNALTNLITTKREAEGGNVGQGKMVLLLQSMGYDINHRLENEATAIMLANEKMELNHNGTKWEKHSSVITQGEIEVYVDHGADLYLKDKNDYSIAHYVIKNLMTESMSNMEKENAFNTIKYLRTMKGFDFMEPNENGVRPIDMLTAIQWKTLSKNLPQLSDALEVPIEELKAIGKPIVSKAEIEMRPETKMAIDRWTKTLLKMHIEKDEEKLSEKYSKLKNIPTIEYDVMKRMAYELKDVLLYQVNKGEFEHEDAALLAKYNISINPFVSELIKKRESTNGQEKVKYEKALGIMSEECLERLSHNHVQYIKENNLIKNEYEFEQEI